VSLFHILLSPISATGLTWGRQLYKHDLAGIPLFMRNHEQSSDSLPALPRNTCGLRVDWVGHVRQNKENRWLASTASVEVLASPLVRAGIRYGQRYDSTKAELYQAPLSDLHTVIIGSPPELVNGMPTGRHPNDVLDVFCLSFQSGATTLALASDVLPVGDPYDSRALYSLHPAMANTRVLVAHQINCANYERVAIPCSEVVRAFYAGQMRLVGYYAELRWFGESCQTNSASTAFVSRQELQTLAACQLEHRPRSR